LKPVDGWPRNLFTLPYGCTPLDHLLLHIRLHLTIAQSTRLSIPPGTNLHNICVNMFMLSYLIIINIRLISPIYIIYSIYGVFTGVLQNPFWRKPARLPSDMERGFSCHSEPTVLLQCQLGLREESYRLPFNPYHTLRFSVATLFRVIEFILLFIKPSFA
jgi:hypothetical protein